MKRALATAILLLALAAQSLAGTVPAERVDSERNQTLRGVYFPFLALGHGVLLLGKYLVAYPIYYLAKPAYDFAYTSNEDPAELAGRHEHERPPQH